VVNINKPLQAEKASYYGPEAVIVKHLNTSWHKGARGAFPKSRGWGHTGGCC
jgi:hypothetical protein